MSGKPLSPEVRATRSDMALIQNIDRSIRTDFGGSKNPIEVVQNKLSKAGFTVNDELATEILYLMKEQVEAVRKRTSHDREELKRRFDQSYMML